MCCNLILSLYLSLSVVWEMSKGSTPIPLHPTTTHPPTAVATAAMPSTLHPTGALLPANPPVPVSPFGGTLRDLELMYVFSTQSNSHAAVDLPQSVIAIICEFGRCFVLFVCSVVGLLYRI
jgi:hypothetical protein